MPLESFQVLPLKRFPKPSSEYQLLATTRTPSAAINGRVHPPERAPAESASTERIPRAHRSAGLSWEFLRVSLWWSALGTLRRRSVRRRRRPRLPRRPPRAPHRRSSRRPRLCFGRRQGRAAGGKCLRHTGLAFAADALHPLAFGRQTGRGQCFVADSVRSVAADAVHPSRLLSSPHLPASTHLLSPPLASFRKP